MQWRIQTTENAARGCSDTLGRDWAAGCGPFQPAFAPYAAAPLQALGAYHQEVVAGAFPSEAFSPYGIAADEAEQLLRELERQGLQSAAEAVEERMRVARAAAEAAEQ